MAVLLVTTIGILVFFGGVAYFLFKGLAKDTWSHDQDLIWHGHDSSKYEKQ